MKRARLCLALLLMLSWTLGWTGVAAQAWPQLNGVVADDTGKLNAGAVNSAAADLQKAGVKPFVVFSQNGLGFSDAVKLGQEAARQYGLTSNGALDPNLLAIVVILSTRQSAIVYGDALKPALEQSGGNGTLADTIRNKYLNPNLAAGDYTGAATQSLQYAAQQINLYNNPPPTATPQPAVINNTNVDTGAIGSALVWIFGGLVLLGALVFLGPALWRQYKKGREAAAHIQALRDQLTQARTTAADMITNLDFPADPNAQIQYRFLALALSRERPQQLAQLTQQYKATYARVADALARFNALNGRQYATEQDLNGAIANYQYVQSTVKEAGDFLQKLDDLEKSVQGQTTAVPGETDAAKKAIAAATDELARLAAAAPDLHLPAPTQALAPAMQNLASAQQSLAANPPLALQAYDQATTAHASADSTLATIQAIGQAYTQLQGERARLANARREGFKLAAADADFAHALAALNTVASKLAAGDSKAVGEAMQAATAAIKQAAAAVDGQLALHASNDKALAALKTAGEELTQYIREGAQAFDKVDEYAPSSWQDIQGNGTEAQRRADTAYALWQEASSLNSAAPNAEQDFNGAASHIAQANTLIAQAQDLIKAIFDRLQNLQKSQATARDEIAAADKSIGEGRAFVQQYDPDITPRPADTLAQAAKQLEGAKAELGNPKPDWIRVVQLARGANDEADKALADARSQEAAMEALRLKVQTTSQQAQASISRAQNFIAVHAGDVDRSLQGTLAQAGAAMQGAGGEMATMQGGGLEDVARAQALTNAAAAYAQAQQAADSAYTQAYNEFQAVDAQRRQAAAAIHEASNAIEQATAYIRDNADAISDSPYETLQRAIAMLPHTQGDTNQGALKVIQAKAQQARELAQEAMQAASSEVQDYNDKIQAQRTAASAANAAAILSMFAGAGSGRQRRGGWGGGSSGGGWGGGGSSSGSWGGGGSSGGSFGGGGSSGGSWGGGGSSSGGW